MATDLWFSGDKPKIPEYPTVDITGEQRDAIQGNTSNLKFARRLGNRVNAYTASALMKQLNTMFPGYSDLLQQSTDVIMSQLRGEIPEDVSQAIYQTTAERARAGGYAGSEFSRNLTTRDLALTSMDITNRALDSASRWMAMAQSNARIFDVSSMFVTPQQRIQTKLFENAKKFERDLLKNRIDALPENWERALGTLFDNIEQSGQAALGAYASQGMSGGGGGGGGGGSMMSMGGGGASGSYPALQGTYGGGVNTVPTFSDYSGTYQMNSGVYSYDLPPMEYYNGGGWDSGVGWP